VDIGPLRDTDEPWIARGVEIHPAGWTYPLAITQKEKSTHGRELVLRKTRRAWETSPDFARHLNGDPPTILPDRAIRGPQWGMAVDLSRCNGCSTCVVACQAENSIPTVGKAMVAMGREMHWMRIDTYYDGDADAPAVLLQPMMCQHCEKAPCEYVCPVNATVHSDDGLNEMVYNRCVGTRFCQNNCPYKVRRFNYYDYNDDVPAVREMVFNPDVTVRARGVMEKCTYCVQRIRRGEIEAKNERRPLRDGDVQTACQQACPTDAIVFGLVSDSSSRVSRHHRSSRAYGVLNELGTRPRTRYLARIDNENEELV
jgi:molybdopterin-containing oxidoreductase family iron-sulfur binding subunit